MRYNNFLLFMIQLICLSFQAYGQMESGGMASGGGWLSPDIGQGASSSTPDEGLEGMVQWLDQPVTTTATPSPEPASTTQSTTTTTTTPGFEATFGLVGILVVAFIALRSRN
jgi:PGF-CTERM protein